MFTNYVQVRDWLESFIPLVYGKEELGLERIENLLNKLGKPQNNFKSILVGGTAGKGSTAFYISRLLNIAGPVRTFPPAPSINSGQAVLSVYPERIRRAVGSPPSSATRKYKIGLHVSPHLIYIGERMQILERQKAIGKRQKFYDGPIPVRRLISLVNEIKPVIDAIGVSQPEVLPSYFEILVALSFLYFEKEKVDIAVVEVGLGGRLDATNVLMPEITVITNVGLDHTELLGDTVEKIAKEKAGIIKTKVPVVTGAVGNALKVIEKEAKSKGSELINIYTQDLKNIRNLDLFRSVFKAKDLNSYIPYYVNSECALLALTTVLELKMPLTDEIIKKAFSRQFAGRFEEIDDGIIVDGAHNTDKIKVLIQWIKSSQLTVHSLQKIILVVAFKKGKNWQEMIDLLIKNLPISKIIATQYFATTDMGKGSAVEAEVIKKYIEVRGQRSEVRVIKNSQEAVFSTLSSSKLTSSQLVLVTGSLYLVGEARTLWKLPEF